MYSKKGDIISAKTGAKKSLIYQMVSLINPEAIVLAITPTIAPMKDQEKELK